MGQRLNVEIVEDGKTLANAYYHWGGYTDSALAATKAILNHINTTKTMPDNTQSELCDKYNACFSPEKTSIIEAIKMLESTEAGLASNEKVWAKTNIKDYDNHIFTNCIDRNVGIISISPEEIQKTRDVEEARVTIDMTNKTIEFDVISIYSKEHYEADYDNDFNSLDLYNRPIDFNRIPFDEFRYIDSYLMKLIGQEAHAMRLLDDIAVVFIIM